ncbi:MAG: diaminopimelate decarboxylase [Actinomycetota bacterium]
MSRAPIEMRLLPDTATIEADGHLSIGGCRLDDLATEFGTPLFVYDETHLRNRCREAVAEFGTGNVIYATKAFLCKAMARLAHEESLMLDVATGGELYVARAAGVPADRCVMHGNNKSEDELRYAVTEGVHHIVVDNFDEIDRLESILVGGSRARVQVRVTPGIHAHTHEFISTGQDDSKFGFNLANGDAMRAIERCRAAAAIDLVGVHFHIGSNVLDADLLGRATRVMVEFFAPLGLPELTVGGGLGVAYTAAEHAPTMGQWASVVRAATAQLPSDVEVMVEPGRSIVASAAVTVYRVGSMKNIPNVRDYVAVDGGMSDNLRPMLYGAEYEAFMPAHPTAVRDRPVRLVGKHCESGDVLIEAAHVPSELAVGDLLAVPVTGAYGYSMSSNYNMVTRPAVVFVADGAARVVRRRESFADLTLLD